MMSGQDVQLPPGFRFHPTDEELVMHYLCRKCSGMSISVPIIADIDLYKYDPWDLPGMAVYGEKEWYFFSPRERKYPNGCRPNRAAASGYWKATGADKAIGGGANSNSNSNSKAVGIKKALVFYAGKAPKGDKTNWIMHEYRLAHVDRSLRNKRNTSTSTSSSSSSSRLDDWVLCRIYNKKGSLDKHLNSHHPKRIMGGLKDTRPEPMTPEQKPLLPSHLPLPLPLPLPHQMMLDHPLDSMPRLHTDSSCCSEHVLSPDFTCDREREVQSQPRWEWDEWDKPHTLPFHNANMSMATRGFTDFGSGLIEPGDPIQDILMFLQKPF